MHALPRWVPVLAAVLTGAAALTGCGGGDTPAPPAAEKTSISSSAPAGNSAPVAGEDTTDEGGTDAPPFPANTDPDTADPSGDALVSLTDVRVGRHDGFDRVVFQVDGAGTPGWDVRYVAEATDQGTGDPVEVEGAAVLQVTLTGTGYPHDTGVEEYPIGEPVSGADTVNVTGTVFEGTLEGRSVAFVGTTAQTPFRVYLLENPVRVVVEVADQG